MKGLAVTHELKRTLTMLSATLFLLLSSIVIYTPAASALNEDLVVANLEKFSEVAHRFWTRGGGRHANPGEFAGYGHLIFDYKCVLRKEADNSFTPVFHVKDWVDEVTAAEWMIGCLYNFGDNQWNGRFTTWRLELELALDPWEGIDSWQELKIARFNSGVGAAEIGFYVVLGYYQLFVPAGADFLITAFQLFDNLTGEQIDTGAAVFDGAFLAISSARVIPFALKSIREIRSPSGMRTGLHFKGEELWDIELKRLEYDSLPGGSLSFRKFAHATTHNQAYISAIKRAYRLTAVRYALPGELLADVGGRMVKDTREIIINPLWARHGAATEAMIIAHELVHAAHLTERVLGTHTLFKTENSRKFLRGLSEVFAYKRSREFIELASKDAELGAAMEHSLKARLPKMSDNQRKFTRHVLESMACLSKEKTNSGKPNRELREAATRLWNLIDYYGSKAFTRVMREKMSPQEFEVFRVTALEWKNFRY